jgi:hypothetical protein
MKFTPAAKRHQMEVSSFVIETIHKEIWACMFGYKNLLQSQCKEKKTLAQSPFKSKRKGTFQLSSNGSCLKQKKKYFMCAEIFLRALCLSFRINFGVGITINIKTWLYFIAMYLKKGFHSVGAVNWDWDLIKCKFPFLRRHTKIHNQFVPTFCVGINIVIKWKENLTHNEIKVYAR